MLLRVTNPDGQAAHASFHVDGAPDPHAYFNALRARPEHHASWSLRDENELLSLVGDPTLTRWSYRPGEDTHPEAQDGAKLYVDKFNPTTGDRSWSIENGQQLKMRVDQPAPVLPPDRLLLTWEWYWPKAFATDCGAVSHYKFFQVRMGGKGWWTLMNAPGPAYPRGQAIANYDAVRSRRLADGMLTNDDRVVPAGDGVTYPQIKYPEAFQSRVGKMTRYWVELRLGQPASAFTSWAAAYNGGVEIGPNPHDPEGRWHMVSKWAADEDREAQRLLYQVPLAWSSDLGWPAFVGQFVAEMNSSKIGALGPLTGYGRNVVALKNYILPNVPEDDTFLFQRPVR